ncbi:MAG: hypothetical protein RMK84_10160 [Oscillochloridaceae bacterium]|nr:hypothetical protein [Chloroflexaceae bacterium]MDW8390476.1 hypothetical protein [Oscillochloridaceae bacterium]
MRNPFQALGAALRDLFDEVFLLLVGNLIWATLSLPLWALALSALAQGAPLAALLAGALGVLPVGLANAGLFYVACRVTDGRATKVADFFAGMRRYLQPALLITLIAAGGALLILFNLGFYLRMNSLLGGFLLGLWLYLSLFWLGLTLYAFPLLMLQEVPSLRLIGRNALLLALGRPIYTFVTLLLMGALLLISLILVAPLALITPAFLALWATRATRALIADARRQGEEAGAGAAGSPPAEEGGREGQARPN